MRSLPPWIGKTHDSPIPPRVRLRVFERFEGTCPVCGRKLVPGKWDCDHITPLALGGSHSEGNLRPVCRVPCHRDKTKEDVALKAKFYAGRKKRAGIRKRSTFACSRDSKFKKKIDGTVVLR